MALVVETADSLQAEAYEVKDFLFVMDKALQTVPSIQLTEINWQLELLPDFEAIAEGNEFIPQTATASGLERPLRADLIKAILSGHTGVSGTLQGRIPAAPSHRFAHEQVLEFIAALQKLPDVSYVQQILMPLDIRPEAEVTTSLDGQVVNAMFTLRVRLESEGNASDDSELTELESSP